MLLPLSETDQGSLQESLSSKTTFINSHTEALLLVHQTHRYIWTVTELEILNIFAPYLSFFKLHHLRHATPVSVSSLFCSPGSPGNQVLNNNHLINSSTHQQCLPSFTHKQTMAEFIYQEKFLDQNITSKQIKPKSFPSTSPPKQPVSHLRLPPQCTGNPQLKTPC